MLILVLKYGWILGASRGSPTWAPTTGDLLNFGPHLFFLSLFMLLDSIFFLMSCLQVATGKGAPYDPTNEHMREARFSKYTLISQASHPPSHFKGERTPLAQFWNQILPPKWISGKYLKSATFLLKAGSSELLILTKFAFRFFSSHPII